MGMYDKIKKTSITKSGAYFSEGRFRVRIIKVKEQESSSDNRIFFIIETEVLTSTVETIPIGSERSQVIDLTQIMGLPNVKQFICAVSGIDTEDIEDNDEQNDLVEQHWTKALETSMTFEDVCEFAGDDSNPLEGLEIDLVCTTIITKGKKQPFTKHTWQAADGLVEEGAAAQ